MKIAVGSDHRGFQLKSRLIPLLEQWGHEVVDQGAHGAESVDYPDFASCVGNQVACGEVERGILICGSGIGMEISANKIPGIRATVGYDEMAAEMCRRHNDVNVLCLSSDRIGEGPIDKIVGVWINTEFEGGRHARRVSKISEIEQGGRC